MIAPVARARITLQWDKHIRMRLSVFLDQLKDSARNFINDQCLQQNAFSRARAAFSRKTDSSILIQSSLAISSCE